MRQIDINEQTVITTPKGSKCIQLGDEIRNEAERRSFFSKLRRRNRAKPRSAWGTLGRATENGFNWSGKLVCSRYGNERSSGVILNEIEDLYKGNDLLDKDQRPVRELFINMSDVTFPEVPEEFDAESIPDARLTIFLDEDEGAIVCYHHYENTWKNPENEELEYILPEPTPAGTTKRDRLDYFFPILPNGQFEEDKVSGKIRINRDRAVNFVIKVLVFRRDASKKTSDALVRSSISLIRKHLDERHCFYKYDFSNKIFVLCKNPATEIESNKKTLLLFHGTFSTTEGSFDGLNEVLKKDKKSGNTWFSSKAPHKYEQIIGFNHSTILEWPEGNLTYFRTLLEGVNFREEPLDVITFSRGGLLGMQFIADQANSDFPVRKAVMVSCANGVGYFDKAKYVGRLLRYFKVGEALSSTPLGAIISLFAQHSAKYFLSLPGPTIMNKDSKELKSLREKSPAEHNKYIDIIAFSGYWSPEVAQLKFLKLLAHGAAFATTTPILGLPNDFVVNTNNQERMMPNIKKHSPIQFKTTHTTFFKSEKTSVKIRKKLDDFLT